MAPKKMYLCDFFRRCIFFMSKPNNPFTMRKNNIIIAACLLVAVLAVTGCWAITKGHSEADP